MLTIVLDPGHGGTVKIGGSSPNNAKGPSGTLEKNLTLQLAKAVRSHASNYANIVLTRENDTNSGLADRAAVARINLADIFISIHFNGFHDPTVQGTETFHHTVGSQRSTGFSQRLQKYVQSATGYRDRGVKYAEFGVLRPDRHHPDTVACLLEVSFLSNPADEVRLQNAAYIDEIARSISEACRTYLADKYQSLLETGFVAMGYEDNGSQIELEDASDMMPGRGYNGRNSTADWRRTPQVSPQPLTPALNLQNTLPEPPLRAPEDGLSAISYDIDPRESPLNLLISEKYRSIGAEVVHRMSPVEIGRNYLQTMMDDSDVALVSPPPEGIEAVHDRVSFKELKSEFDPLTEVHFVKFRQVIDGVPVYGSFVSMSVDEEHNVLNFNSTLKSNPGNKTVARVSAEQAQEIIRPLVDTSAANTVPELNHFYREKGQTWHLAYIFKDILMALDTAQTHPETVAAQDDNHQHDHGRHNSPVIMDIVVDALTGEVLELLSRVETAHVSAVNSGFDGLGRERQFQVSCDDTRPHLKWMHDIELNVHTCDYNFADIAWDRISHPLPGPYCEMQDDVSEFSEAAIAAHANTARVLRFFKTVLKRQGIDGNGGAAISTINCVRKSQNNSRIWPNAARLSTQMVYGQDMIDGKLRSYAESQDVVAHELLHGVIAKTSRLKYEGETGALNESYADIFGIIISNNDEADLDHWNWELGEDLSKTRLALRDFSDPGRRGQPAHYDDFVVTAADHAGVHTNSGIHNMAAYNVMTHRADNGDYTFSINDFTILFYLTVTQQLSRTSSFVDSLRGMLRIANLLFRDNVEAERAEKRNAIIRAYQAAGIIDPNNRIIQSSNGVPLPPGQSPTDDIKPGGRKPELDVQDVSLVKGIGPKTSKELADEGVTDLQKLSALSERDIDVISKAIGVSPKRLRGWVEKAKDIS